MSEDLSQLSSALQEEARAREEGDSRLLQWVKYLEEELKKEREHLSKLEATVNSLNESFQQRVTLCCSTTWQ